MSWTISLRCLRRWQGHGWWKWKGKKIKKITPCLGALHHRIQTLILYINWDNDEERLVFRIRHKGIGVAIYWQPHQHGSLSLHSPRSLASQSMKISDFFNEWVLNENVSPPMRVHCAQSIAFTKQTTTRSNSRNSRLSLLIQLKCI